MLLDHAVAFGHLPQPIMVIECRSSAFVQVPDKVEYMQELISERESRLVFQKRLLMVEVEWAEGVRFD